MKTFLTKSKSSFALLMTLAVMPVWAKPVAQVTEISGQVFMITAEGKTRSLKAMDHLEDKSEVMVEEGGSITLNDYYDATYHLTGGSHLKFFNRSVQLKRGKTWIQSLNSRHPLALTTANGHVDFWKGEFITTFDQNTSRSQILVVNGDVEVSNILDKNTKYTVPAGSFTLVDPEVENGVPRSPTKVGLASLNNALGEFKKLPEKMIHATPARTIASVEEEVPSNAKKGKIIFISSQRLPARVPASAHQYYQKSVGTKPVKKVVESAAVPINFYGTSWKKTEALEIPRTPASYVPQVVLPKKQADSLNIDPEFSETLKGQTAAQPKHSKELQGLIDDLKSY